jgi:hypothetical protein
MLNIAQCFD